MGEVRELTSLQESTLYSKFKEDLSHLQTIIESVSSLQADLSMKMENLSIKQEQTSDTVKKIISGMSSDGKQASNTERNESPELIRAINSIKKDVDRKIDFNKEFKAEILENNIKNDVRMDKLESLISSLSNELLSLERLANRNETLVTREGFSDLEKKVEDLLIKQDDHSSSSQKINEQQTKHTTELELLKNKLDSLEEMLRQHNHRIDEVKIKCGEVCHLFAARVLPLNDGLSQNVRAIEVCNRKILVLENNAENLKSFATKMMFSPVGFSAYLKEPIKLSTSNTLLNSFTDVRINLQDCFNPATGYFTAPVDGLYSVSLTLCQMSTGFLEAFIIHAKHTDQTEDSWVAHVIGHREINGNSDTGLAVVAMKKQDKLCIKVTDLGLLNCPRLTECTSFSCFLINRC